MTVWGDLSQKLWENINKIGNLSQKLWENIKKITRKLIKFGTYFGGLNIIHRRDTSKNHNNLWKLGQKIAEKTENRIRRSDGLYLSFAKCIYGYEWRAAEKYRK